MLQQGAHCRLISAGFEPVSAPCKAVPLHCCGNTDTGSNPSACSCLLVAAGSRLQPLGLNGPRQEPKCLWSLRWLVKSSYRSGCRGRLQCQVQLTPGPQFTGIGDHRNGTTHVSLNEVLPEEAMPLYKQAWKLCHMLHYKVGRQTTTR